LEGIRMPILGHLGCCAKSGSAHALAMLTRKNKSRRLICAPKSLRLSRRRRKRLPHRAPAVCNRIKLKKGAPSPIYIAPWSAGGLGRVKTLGGGGGSGVANCGFSSWNGPD